MKKIFLVIISLSAFFVSNLLAQPKEPVVLIKTTMGDIKVKLYNETPKHRDNFLKLVNQKFYDSLLFHRVIKNFMIQGGDPDSKHAKSGQALGMGGPGYNVPAEFNSKFFHKRGAIATARDNNPKKESNGSQFYIVQGKKITSAELDGIEQQKHIKYTPEQRKSYTTIGGVPALDQDYTVFGEVISGIDVLDKIEAVQTGQNDRPINDVRIISMKLIK